MSQGQHSPEARKPNQFTNQFVTNQFVTNSKVQQSDS